MSMPSTAEATARYSEQEWKTRVELAAFRERVAAALSDDTGSL